MVLDRRIQRFNKTNITKPFIRKKKKISYSKTKTRKKIKFFFIGFMFFNCFGLVGFWVFCCCCCCFFLTHNVGNKSGLIKKLVNFCCWFFFVWLIKCNNNNNNNNNNNMNCNNNKNNKINKLAHKTKEIFFDLKSEFCVNFFFYVSWPAYRRNKSGLVS